MRGVCCERTVSSGESQALGFWFLDCRNGLYVGELGEAAKNCVIVQ